MKAHLEKLIELASECSVIASQATDKAKRDLFARLAQHYGVLAVQVEAAIETAKK